MSHRTVAVLGAWLAASLLLVARQPSAPGGGVRFEDVADQSGLRFTHDNGARGEFWLPEIMGAGVAVFDYDGDGDLDVFLVQGAPAPTSGATPAPAARGAATSVAAARPSRLFRNDLNRPGGTLRFTDVTAEAGVGLVAQGMGVAVGDIDNDGDLDLYVTTFGDNVLYRNDGGRFTDVTAAAGANDPRWSSSAAFVDYDRDGFLDLFVANYVDFTPAGNKRCHEPGGARDYCAPLAYRPVPSRLLRNRGNGTFEDASERAGITRAFGNGLGVAVGDYDDNGWPDLYVANDATANQLWMNGGKGTFDDMGMLSGTAYNAAGRPEGSMGIASADYDRDGDEDLVVTNLVGETFVLYENDGAGGFEDRRAPTGLAARTGAMTGFGTQWFDADNDGWLDLFLANGAVNLVPARRGTASPFAQRNQLLLGRPASPATGAGATRAAGRVRLEDVSERAGAPFGMPDVGRGVAVGDLDQDGRVDLVVTHNRGRARVLRNLSPTAHWIGFRLTQPDANRHAVGARIVVDDPSGPIARRVTSAGSYLSASDLRVHVGLGSRTSPVAATVHWPDGQTQRVEGLAVDRVHDVARRP